MKDGNTSRALTFGLGAGFLSVLCCVGPIIPILIGVGSASALAGLDAYKPIFIGGGLILLAGASWYAVRKQNGCCVTKSKTRSAKIVALIFGVGILSYGVLQYAVIPALFDVASKKIEKARQVEQAQAEPVANVAQRTLEVQGMTCAGCAIAVKEALLNVPGVLSAHVDWQTSIAEIRYDSDTTNVSHILNAKVEEQYNLIERNSTNEKSE